MFASIFVKKKICKDVRSFTTNAVNILDNAKVKKLAVLIEQICKTEGRYIDKIAVSPDQAIKSILNQYSEFRPSVEACLKDRKNYVNEIIRFSQNNEAIKDNVSLAWFKKFLKYILECVKHGLHLAKSFLNKILGINLTEASSKDFLKNYKPAVTIGSAILCGTGLCLGIVSAVVLLGISLWLFATGKIIKKLSSKPSILEKLKQKGTKWFGREEDDLPDDLAPPDLDVPNVTMSFNVNTSESLLQYAKDKTKYKLLQVCIKCLCIFCLKSVLALYMSSDLAWGVAMFIAIFTPGMNLITYLLIWVFIGCCSAYKLLTYDSIKINEPEMV